MLELEKIEFEPNSYKISNLKDIKNKANQIASQYTNIVVADEDTYKSAYKQRAEVRKLRDEVDEVRKSVKRNKLAEIEQFEIDMKSVAEIYNEAWQEIDGSIKAYDDHQKELKKQAIDKMIEDLSEGYPIEFNPQWLNKTYKESNIEDDIRFQVIEAKREEERIEKESQVVVDTCKTFGIDPYGWLDQLKRGVSLTDVLTAINAVEQRKATRDEEKKVEAEPKVEPKKTESEPMISDVIKITGTMSQFKALNQYLIESGLVVERYES